MPEKVAQAALAGMKRALESVVVEVAADGVSPVASTATTTEQDVTCYNLIVGTTSSKKVA